MSKIKNYIEGISTIFDIWGSNSYIYKRKFKNYKNDTEAIQSDWEKVGQYIDESLKNVKNEIQRNRKTNK